MKILELELEQELKMENNKIPNLPNLESPANSANKVPKNFKNAASVDSTRNGNGN